MAVAPVGATPVAGRHAASWQAVRVPFHPRQVIANLLHNATRFTSAGYISLACRLLAAPLSRTPRGAALAVRARTEPPADVPSLGVGTGGEAAASAL